MSSKAQIYLCKKPLWQNTCRTDFHRWVAVACEVYLSLFTLRMTRNTLVHQTIALADLKPHTKSNLLCWNSKQILCIYLCTVHQRQYIFSMLTHLEGWLIVNLVSSIEFMMFPEMQKTRHKVIFFFPHHIALICNIIVYWCKTTVLDGCESKAFILVNNRLAEALRFLWFISGSLSSLLSYFHCLYVDCGRWNKSRDTLQ